MHHPIRHMGLIQSNTRHVFDNLLYVDGRDRNTDIETTGIKKISRPAESWILNLNFQVWFIMLTDGRHAVRYKPLHKLLLFMCFSVIMWTMLLISLL